MDVDEARIRDLQNRIDGLERALERVMVRARTTAWLLIVLSIITVLVSGRLIACLF